VKDILDSVQGHLDEYRERTGKIGVPSDYPCYYCMPREDFGDDACSWCIHSENPNRLLEAIKLKSLIDKHNKTFGGTMYEIDDEEQE